MSNPNIRLRVLPALLPVDGKQIELQSTDTFIQWRYVTDASGEYAWVDLVALADITGPEGPAIEMRTDGTSIQYRQIGAEDWIDLLPLADIKGEQGEQGPQGIQGATGATGPAGPGSSDGDKGDITVSGTGTVWTLDAVVNRAKLTSAMSKTIGISVFEYGAVGDNSTDDGAAFEAAQTAAVSAGSKLVVVPQGAYRINTRVDISAGVTWLFLGARLTTTTDTMTILSADTIDDWAILGDLRLIGSLSTPASTAQYGLKVKDCNRYRVEGVTGQNLKGAAFWLTGTASPGERGDRGQFGNCAAYDCTVGRQLDAGAGAEYTSWSNWHASDCATGDIIGAGNTVTVGGSIVDNDLGISLLAGANHGHGIYSGVQINHNTVNLHAEDVTNGYSFSGCHLYEGEIQIDNCDGIVIEGGFFDVASVVLTTGADAGFNYFRNNWWPGSYGPTSFTGDGLAGLVVQGATGPGVPARNTFCEVEVHVYRNKASTQSVTTGVAATILFNSETADAAAAYDTSTGIFTVPVGQGGNYEFTWAIVASGTALSATGSLVELQVDGNGGSDSFTSQALSAAAIVSTTTLAFSGVAALRLSDGANARMRATITGTSPLVGHASYYCLWSIKKLGN